MVIITLICSEGYKIPITGPLMKVEIKNNNTYILDVHCKSADDDIGSRALKNGKVTKGVFDIYDALRDFKRCTRCTWMAETDGLYGFSEKKPPPAAVFYKWLK
ncbi:hypothetical protein IGI04_004425 [Brassica rapa subsp. trilocularis]|uniref:S-protein homolog n=1 Tax=Brassica rapa subsp. trilocularis TaxID=1813537 RepID=A0ABQ7NB25_BRACM|nr:hypothetical protein IGI04_004425 [Brassica rapa subsp. trilocularis]